MRLPSLLSRPAASARCLEAARLTLLLCVVVALFASTMSIATARIDRQACRHTDTRLRDADSFALDVCFDGATLYVMNRTDIPLHVAADGAGPAYQRPIKVPPPLSLAYVYTHPSETNLLMPGYRLEFPVGAGAVTVGIAQTDHGRGYAIGRSLLAFIPDEVLVAVPEKVIAMFNELLEVYDQHQACLSRSGPIGDLACEALYLRNVAFAIGRLVVGAVAKSLVSAVLGLGDLVSLTDKSSRAAIDLQRHGRFSIDAAASGQGAPPPVPVRPPPQSGQPQSPERPGAAIRLTQGSVAALGYWYSVTLTGFSPASEVTVTCRDSVTPGGFWTQTFKTNGSGDAGDSTLCYSADGPDHWVTGGGVESNRVNWSGSGPPPTPPPTAPPPTAARTFTEQSGRFGSPAFRNPANASGQGTTVPAMSYVEVSCKVKPASTIASAHPDGYWYRIASSPWNNEFYAVANTFWNGDVPGQTPYTHNTDFNVPDC